MRDLILTPLFIYGPLVALFNPVTGVFFWTWVSLMSPQKLSWRLTDKPVALALAVGILVGMVFTNRKRFLLTKETVAFMMFGIWVLFVSYPLSIHFEECYEMWDKVWRVDLMILVTIALLRSKQDIIRLIWVIAFSVGFYGFKGGIFTILHGGHFQVWGPEGGWFAGNNECALAIVIVIPLINFLRTQVPSKAGKAFCSVWMVLCVFSALGSQSRGALLAVVAMAFMMWTRQQKNKVPMALAFIIFGIVLVTFMPDSWTKRMHTIDTYQTDESAAGRLNAWEMTFNLAKDHPIHGGGFSIYNMQEYLQYAPVPRPVVAHSIYFSVLGEQGFVGLFLFLNVWWQLWRGAGRLRTETRNREETRWVSELAGMCQVSVAAYLVGGAFLSLAYFDLPYNILVLAVLARQWVKDKGWETEPLLTGRLAPAWAAMGVGKQ